MKSYVVDLGGSTIKVAVIIDGEINQLDFIKVNSSEINLDEILVEVESTIKRLDESTKHLKSAGIGIAFPGIVNPVEKRIVVSNDKYPNACNVNLVKWADEVFGLPIELDNDANAALLGEVSYGVAKGSQDVTLMILGTGVGTAAIMNGQLVRGRHFQAGCLGGHFTVNLDGPRCNCGNTGCVEANASTWALPLQKERMVGINSELMQLENFDFKVLRDYYQKGDKAAVKLVDDCIKAWGSGLVNLVHAYDPETIVLSGGVIYFEELIEPLKQWVWDHAWTPWGKVDFKVSQTPQSSVLLGLHHKIEQLY